MNLKKELKIALRYTKESKNFVYAAALIFVSGVLGGFVLSSHLGFLDEILRKVAEETRNLSTFRLIIYILINNFLSSVLGLFLGIFLGIFSIWVSLYNGVIVGYVLNKVYETDGIGKFWLLFPHGIFELPAVFISLGLGIRLGFFVFSKNRVGTLLENLLNSIRVVILIIVPLLLAGAIIEGVLIGVYK